VILLMVAGSLYMAFVFSYLYIWTVAPQHWPPAAGALPALTRVAASVALLLAAAGAVLAAGRVLAISRAGCAVLVATAVAALAGSLWLEVSGHWATGLRPDASGYAALVYLASALQLQIVGAIIITAGFTVARLAAGLITDARRVTFESLALLICYAAGQGLLGLLVVHGFPRGLA
jgi:cytochrome c oxidase subunit I+III